jgi:hypothetical protein
MMIASNISKSVSKSRTGGWNLSRGGAYTPLPWRSGVDEARLLGAASVRQLLGVSQNLCSSVQRGPLAFRLIEQFDCGRAIALERAAPGAVPTRAHAGRAWGLQRLGRRGNATAAR